MMITRYIIIFSAQLPLHQHKAVEVNIKQCILTAATATHSLLY